MNGDFGRFAIVWTGDPSDGLSRQMLPGYR